MGKQWKSEEHYILLPDNNISSEKVSLIESTLGI